MLHIIKLNAFY